MIWEMMKLTMSIALFNVICLFFIVFISKAVEEKNLKSSLNVCKENNLITQEGNDSKILIICFGIILFVEMAFRGDSTVDTIQNFDSFHNYFYFESDLLVNLQEYWNNEFGFRYIGYLVKKYFNNYLLFSSITSFIIASSYSIFIKKYSKCKWMSMLVLLCSGSFYAGFNLHKQIIAAGLFALCFSLIIKGKFKTYLLCVLGISLFHFSAIVLLPVYFFLRLRIRNKTNLLVSVTIFLILIFLFTPIINSFVGSVLFPEYMEEGAYRMNEGAPLFTLIKLIVLPLYVLLNLNTIDFNDDKDRICVNGCIACLVVAIASSRIYMLQRYTNYFIPYIMISYATILSKYKGKIRRTKAVEMCFLLILSNINPIIHYDYYFFWNNQFRDFIGS
nr:EpsG family protein [Ruminococcus flavefaciens]